MQPHTQDVKSTQLGGIANLALLAPVKPGFVPGADTVPHARRLELLFTTMNAIRLGSRESARLQNPFPDALGRWGILHSFRYALIEPSLGDRGAVPADANDVRPGTFRLYLNVGFDGGWEPYLRVIYRDLGPMLDTIFANCEGYPASSGHTFEAYARWVRSHEVPAGIFYTESSLSVQDQRYLEAVERLQRHTPDPARARAQIAGLALKPAPELLESLGRFGAADAPAQAEVVRNHLRALKGLYDLRAVYPDNPEGDEDCLLRFAHSAMPEFRALMQLRGGEYLPFREQIDWLLRQPRPRAPVAAPPADWDESDVQAGIATPYAGVTHGCLLLLAVTDAAAARQWIGTLADEVARSAPHADGRLYANIAVTARGLCALGLPQEPLARFPQEFIDGMEARAGLLGDVRGNHPQHWRRPRGQGVEIDLASVHLVLQYRLAASADDDALLHPCLALLAQQLADADNGLLLLGTEAMRSYPLAPSAFGATGAPGTSSRHESGTVSTEHFGFQDGFSQPVVRGATGAPTGIAFDDGVARGELFLGHPNDRQDGRFPGQPDALMDNGSFLVIRKLRQHVDRWQQVLAAAARRADAGYDRLAPAAQADAREGVAAKMMGRRFDGTPLIEPPTGRGTVPGNDFNYDTDPAGASCPFQSHMRRANPRLLAGGKRRVPRLLRRGMSYGPRFDRQPEAERGLFFMAYCGSIAEQFEVVQRWMAGGNSSGILASHSDPLLGVPQPGAARSFQWLGEDGGVHRVDLGDRPLADLAWGLYAFAPSITGMKALANLPAAQSAPAQPPPPPDPKQEDYAPAGPAFEDRRRLLRGTRADRDRIWTHVGRCGGTLQTAYGRLLSDKFTVLSILNDTHAADHSVCGFGRRFQQSVGPGFLGMDPAGGHTRRAETSGIDQAIVDIDEPTAFDAARQVTQALLARLPDGGAEGWPVDVVRLGETVIAGLYRRWFGLPDERHMFTGHSAERIVDLQHDEARCPRDFFHVARYLFDPHPAPAEIEKGVARGQAIQRAVRAYLAATPPQELVGLSRSIHDGLMNPTADGPGLGLDAVAHTIGGVMLGFGPSVHLHHVNVMRAWVEAGQPGQPTLWDLQVRLRAAGGPDGGHEAAVQALRKPLVEQMRREPVPSMVWRERPGSRPGDGGREPPKTVLGLHALMDDADAEALMFGGSRAPGSALKTIHACPGHGMAIGVLMGLVCTLLLAGTLRRSPSPSILMLVR